MKAFFLQLKEGKNSEENIDNMYWDRGRGAIAKIVFPTANIAGTLIDNEFKIYKKQIAEFELMDTYSSENLELLIVERSSISTKFDFDNLYLVPSKLSMRFYDGNKFVYNKIFDESDIYEKDFYVTQKINGEKAFAGKVDISTLRYDKASETISFTAVSPLDRLNSTFLTDAENEPTNPLSVIDPINYAMEYEYAENGTDKIFYYPKERQGKFIKLTKIIKDIYKYADIADVDFLHNWEFKAIKPPIGSSGAVDKIGDFEDVSLKPSQLFLSSDFETIGDVLRHLGKLFGCFTGSLNFDKAFFNKLLYGTYYPGPFDDGGSLLDESESYEYGKIDFSMIEDKFNEVDKKYYEPEKTSYTNKSNKSISFKNNVELYLTVPEYNAVFQLEDKFYKIIAIKEPLLSNNYFEPGSIVAKFWFAARGNFDLNKVKIWKFSGLTQKFTDIINFDDKNYQIIEMEKHVPTYITTIKAIKTLGQ